MLLLCMASWASGYHRGAPTHRHPQPVPLDAQERPLAQPASTAKDTLWANTPVPGPQSPPQR